MYPEGGGDLGWWEGVYDQRRVIVGMKDKSYVMSRSEDQIPFCYAVYSRTEPRNG